MGQCFLAFAAREKGTKRPTGRMVERSGGVWCKLSRLGREIRAKRSEIGRERGEFCSWAAAIESKDWFICMQLAKPVFLSQSIEYELVVCCFSLCYAKNSVFRFLETEEGTLARFLIDLLWIEPSLSVNWQKQSKVTYIRFQNQNLPSDAKD